jgi:hypothetical protein
MDDEMPFASHLVKRGETYHYVRRIPNDVADAFPLSRVQRSLRTKDRATAYQTGARVHAEIEAQFAAARRRKGATLDLLPTDDWTWADWRALAEWLKSTLADEDWRARLKNLPGAAFGEGVPRNCFWRDDAVVHAHIELQKRLNGMTVAAYAEERFAFAQSLVRRLGVALSRSSPYFDRFMAACLKAEIEYLGVFFAREGGKMEELPHPDTIEGRWRQAAEQAAQEKVARILGGELAKGKAVGRTFDQCLEQWRGDRDLAHKRVTEHGLAAKRNAIAAFQSHAKVKDIGEITRAQLVSFRDWLFKQGYETPTVNKKVGQITTLLDTAQKAGWIDSAISGGIYIDIPAGTSEREPFEPAELDRIFTKAAFQGGARSDSEKAGGILEFWLPLISVVSGLISTEILQLGPDTVGPHPDHPEIICFNVTNAGGRSIKAFARKRYVPVRAELWTNGLMEIVENARRQGWKTLWPAAEVNPDLTSLSNMFSGFWSDFLRKQVGVGDPKKTLYSLRHNFRDAIATAGGADFERDQLMGHSEQGTGRKYGAKRTPRAVDIVRLNDLVQKASWLFLQSVRWPQN